MVLPPQQTPGDDPSAAAKPLRLSRNYEPPSVAVQKVSGLPPGLLVLVRAYRPADHRVNQVLAVFRASRTASSALHADPAADELGGAGVGDGGCLAGVGGGFRRFIKVSGAGVLFHELLQQ